MPVSKEKRHQFVSKEMQFVTVGYTCYLAHIMHATQLSSTYVMSSTLSVGKITASYLLIDFE